MKTERSSTTILIILIGGLLLNTLPRKASAIPAFARKYGTSCQTCHVVFPSLTPFGEAFKRNGLRFPGDTEEEATQDEPTALGAEGYKKVFPNAVWPGVIPGQIPLAMVINSTYAYTPSDKDEGIFEDHSFEGFGATFGLIAAGTMGGRISFWAGGSLNSDGEAEVERVYAQFNLFNTPIFNVKVGQFEPGLTEVSIHRSFLPGYWYLTRPVGDNEWAPEPTQQAIELQGTMNGRLGYNFGVSEGSGNVRNKEKDLYGRIEFKLRGMRLDGVSGEEGSSPKSLPKPWRDDSVTFSTFFYHGLALLGDKGGVNQEDSFWRYGGDVNANYGNLRLGGGYMFQQDDQPLLTAPHRQVDSMGWFAETSYVVRPFLVPAIRYEQFNSDLQDHADNRLVVGLVALIRANVRVRVHADFQGLDGDALDAKNVFANLALAW